MFGLLVGLVLFAPAAWLAKAVASATDQRLLLADARGTIWSGSAVPSSPAAPTAATRATCPAASSGRCRRGSTASSCGAPGLLPQRHAEAADPPRLRPDPRHAMRRRPALARRRPVAERLARRPRHAVEHAAARRHAARIASPGFTIESGPGPLAARRQLDLELEAVSSRLTTLDTLGSYRVTLTGGAGDGSATLLSLTTHRRPAAADRQRHLGPGRRQVPRRSPRRRRPTRPRCPTCSTSSVGATAPGRSSRSDDHDTNAALRRSAARAGAAADGGGADAVARCRCRRRRRSPHGRRSAAAALSRRRRSRSTSSTPTSRAWPARWRRSCASSSSSTRA